MKHEKSCMLTANCDVCLQYGWDNSQNWKCMVCQSVYCLALIVVCHWASRLVLVC